MFTARYREQHLKEVCTGITALQGGKGGSGCEERLDFHTDFI